MKMLLGIGNTDLGDDGVGVYVAETLASPDWTCVDCGTVPENFTGLVRKHHPELLLLVDAARMGLAPGAVRRVPPASIEDVGIGTHSLPLSHIIGFLSDAADEIVFVGIQPKATEWGTGLSPEILSAAERVVELLQQDRLAEIPEFLSPA
jgi:hydrogenase 3 maturation protease